VLGEHGKNAGDIGGPVAAAGEEIAEGGVGEEGRSAVEVIEGEFDAVLGAAPPRRIGGDIFVVGFDDEFAVVAALDGDGGGGVEREDTDHAAGDIGDAAHEVEARGCAADDNVLVALLKHCGVVFEEGEELRDGIGGGHGVTPRNVLNG